MRQHLIILGTAALLALGATAAFAAAGGVNLGDMDQRALQPPVDLTQQQLRAQEPPAQEPPAYEGRSVAVPFWWYPPAQREDWR